MWEHCGSICGTTFVFRPTSRRSRDEPVCPETFIQSQKTKPRFRGALMLAGRLGLSAPHPKAISCKPLFRHRFPTDRPLDRPHWYGPIMPRHGAPRQDSNLEIERRELRLFAQRGHLDLPGRSLGAVRLPQGRNPILAVLAEAPQRQRAKRKRAAG